jgi:hypothetical protein
MTPPPNTARPRPGPAAAWLAAGLVLAALGWLLPVNVGSVPPALLAAAGAGTPSLTDYGRELLEREKLGPAALFLAAARRGAAPHSDAFAADLARLSARLPDQVRWGGWDPFLDPLFKAADGAGTSGSTPILTFFITESARRALRGYLQNSRSLGVQALLATREVTLTTRFIPATQPGGQPLDAVILLAALLYQGEHLSTTLQRELRTLAEEAAARRDMGALEDTFLDLLSLGKRLDWIQLTELVRRTDGTKTLREYAHLARAAPDDFVVIYAAALFSGSADRVAAYLLTFGSRGLEDVALAAGHGQGAVQLLLRQQVPVIRTRGPTLGETAHLALLYPHVTLAIKWAAVFLGAFALLRGVDRVLFPVSGPGREAATTAVLAALCAGLVILFSEPYLLKTIPPSEFALRLAVPVLATLGDPESLRTVEPTLAMDTSTLLSIALFALLQVGWFFICLRKIAEIARSDLTPLVKLRLMENEENLFDGGLYLGIAGTATALVLQVLGLIQPNLLAAYSSNLFGIVCVALVKIRHVRPFKYRLILAGQVAAAPPPTVGASS